MHDSSFRVKMSRMTTTKTYHHGDLRAALLTAARAKLASDGYEALSLRELARDAGVASSAPYAHFDSREALLWALVNEGGQELSTIFGSVASTPATATDRLAMASRAYLAFAKAQPEMMRLLFVAPLSTERFLPAAAAKAREIFEHLVADVLVSEDELCIRNVAICCWSSLHGFMMLRLHNRLTPEIDEDQMAETIIDAAVRLVRTARFDLTD